MKYWYSLPILAGLMASPAFAQINITQNDVAPIGRKFAVAGDMTLVNIAPGSAGSSQTWNLSTLSADLIDTISVVDPLSTPYAFEYPNANIAMVTSYQQYSFGKLTANGFEISAQRDGMFGMGDVHYLDADRVIELPLHFGDQYSDTVISYTKLPMGYDPGIGQVVDSVRITTTIHETSVADGQGTCITPLGSFAALRVNTLGHNNQLVEYLINGQWTVESNTFDSTRTYAYWASGVGMPLAELTVELGNNTVIDASWVADYAATVGLGQTLPPMVFSVYPSPASDVVNMEGKTDGNSQLHIYDVAGRELRRETLGAERTTIGVSDLSTGVYFYLVTDASGIALARGSFSVAR